MHDRRERIIAKALLLLFEKDEDELINIIMSLLVNSDAQIIQQDICTDLSFPGMNIDLSKRIVYRDGKEIKMSFVEFEILTLLARNPGRTFSKEQIYQIVWKESYAGDPHIVMSHIKNIRKKIEEDPSKPVYIQTVWGVGYRFNKNLSNDP